VADASLSGMRVAREFDWPVADRGRPRMITKIHAVVDAEGRPIRLKLTEGQTHNQ
jgi:hypothetical protein